MFSKAGGQLTARVKVHPLFIVENQTLSHGHIMPSENKPMFAKCKRPGNLRAELFGPRTGVEARRER